jgi:hypothetical protein
MEDWYNENCETFPHMYEYGSLKPVEAILRRKNGLGTSGLHLSS